MRKRVCGKAFSRINPERETREGHVIPSSVTEGEALSTVTSRSALEPERAWRSSCCSQRFHSPKISHLWFSSVFYSSIKAVKTY